MHFDINKVFNEMINTVKDSVSEGANDIGGYAKTIMDNEKESMEELAKALFDGEIDEEDFYDEIKREKKVVETEFLALQVMTKAMTQKVVNEAMDVFVNAVRLAI